MVSQDALRNIFWAIDGVGLIVATALLALKFFRKGQDFVAARFLVFAIGEAVMLSGMAAGLSGSVPAFAAGTSLWAASLLLVSIPREFPIFTRAVGVVSAVLFAVTAMLIFSGQPLSPITKPLPTFAYPLLVLTFVGWIWKLLREA